MIFIESSAEVRYFGPRLLGFIVFCIALIYLLGGAEDYEERLKRRMEVLNINGEGNILLTAPHGILHIRDGKEKPADADTTAIVNKLAASRPMIYTAIAWKQNKARDIAKAQGWSIVDPNYMPIEEVPRSPFYLAVKSRLEKRKNLKPTILVDVHGMKDSHEGVNCDISLGFGAWCSHDPGVCYMFQNCLVDELRSNPMNEGYNIDCLDNRFTGNRNKQRISVSRTAVLMIGVPAFQIELSKRIRTKLISDEENLERLGDAIEKCSRIL